MKVKSSVPNGLCTHYLRITIAVTPFLNIILSSNVCDLFDANGRYGRRKRKVSSRNGFIVDSLSWILFP